MEPSELVKALGEGVEGRGIDCLAGVFVAIAAKANMPIKSMRLTFHEGPITNLEWKFPKLNGGKGEPCFTGLLITEDGIYKNTSTDPPSRR